MVVTGPVWHVANGDSLPAVHAWSTDPLDPRSCRDCLAGTGAGASLGLPGLEPDRALHPTALVDMGRGQFYPAGTLHALLELENSAC